MTSFSSLPLDILLVVFRELDVVGSVRLGMTCRGLSEIAQDRQVWADQLEKLRQEDSMLKPATPPLASMSAQELKTFVTGRAKLRLRLKNGANDLGFAARGVTVIPGICIPMLLPGGKLLLAMDYSEGTTLRRIELEDGQASLPIVSSVKLGQRMSLGAESCQLFITMSPHPMFVHVRMTEETSIRITEIDQHSGTMNLKTTFCLPQGGEFPRFDGQGRLIGFLFQLSSELARVVIIHLDHPGVTIESDIPLTYAPTADRRPCRICLPTENLVIVHQMETILACKIPDFSGLSPGNNPASIKQMWSWPGLGQSDEWAWDRLTYTASESVYDPHSARAFDLYYVSGAASQVTTVTVPINTDEDDPASKPGELPALKQESTVIEDGREGRDTFGCGCKALHVRRLSGSDGETYVVVPLKNLPLRGSGGALWMFVHREELDLNPQLDIDEATGRVVIWGWDMAAQETKVFIGNLV